jgi:hypothetical protein
MLSFIFLSVFILLLDCGFEEAPDNQTSSNGFLSEDDIIAGSNLN